MKNFLCAIPGRGGNQIIVPYRGDEQDYRGLRLMGDLGQIMFFVSKGGVKRGHNVADTLLRIRMFPCLPAHATFVADTKFVSKTQKMFLISFRNILCRQQMFPSLRSTETIMSNNVSAIICPRLPPP